MKDPSTASRNNPGANYYNPEHRQTEQERFHAISFGVGNRGSVNGKILETPGPGTYKLASPFDKGNRYSTRSNFFSKRKKSKKRKVQRRTQSMATLEPAQTEKINVRATPVEEEKS